jgi:hypothetical protein
MIEFERIGELCERLGLGTMATHVAHVADEAARKQLSFQEFFEQLLQAEYRERQERTRALLTRTAGFPGIKTLDQYDFEFATGAPKPLPIRSCELLDPQAKNRVVVLFRAVVQRLAIHVEDRTGSPFAQPPRLAHVRENAHAALTRRTRLTFF